MSKNTVCRVSKMPSKPLSLDPYLEVLREKVTGDKRASIRKYCRMKLKKLTGGDSHTSTRKGRAGKPNPA